MIHDSAGFARPCKALSIYTYIYIISAPEVADLDPKKPTFLGFPNMISLYKSLKR